MAPGSFLPSLAGAHTLRAMPQTRAKSNDADQVPRKWIFIGIYLVLLAASWVYQRWIEPAPAHPPQSILLEKVAGSFNPNRLPIVVIPRLPDEAEQHTLSRVLAGHPNGQVFRMAWPRARLGEVRADSSASQIAEELHALLPPGRVHLVGQGMGGVVALELASAHPERVASLALISAPGAQEYTLLGNAVANKFVYFFHHAAFVLLDNLTPHFGWANRLPMNRAYSSVFFDTDLSESRQKLATWAGPTVILHGEDDWITPADAARYSAKLMPQAEIEVTPGVGHAFRPFLEDAAIGPWLRRFQGDAERAAPVAPREKPIEADLVNTGGARYWILLLVIVLCTFVAEDPTCLACGLLVSQGVVDFTSAALACTVGIFIGDMVLYTIGRTLGRGALRHPPLKWIVQEHQIDQMAGWFSSPRGLMVIVSSRFIPASRVPTFVTAGLLRLSLPRLGALLFTAALVWTPVLMWLGYTFGPPFMEQFPHYKQYAAWIIVGTLLSIWFLTHWVLPGLTWKGRREVLMKWRRLTRPSLWSSAMLYLPVRLAVIFTSIRLRSLTAFASANPSFGRMGGFIGDEKGGLLEPFESDPRTCPTLRLSADATPEERIAAARAFVAAQGYPLVLKPEISEDGAGLRRVEDAASLEAALADLSEDFVLQPWLVGREFEVVWRRAPGSAAGILMAVVEKADVTVIGDGRRTLEALILADDQAVSRAELYLHLNSRRVAGIPAAGEIVRLNASGSHGHGAAHRHRPDLETEGLRLALTDYCRRFPGLHYARLDLRVAAESGLESGDFRVTEIGGCCHVSSVIRDHAVPLTVGYQIVWRQVRLCLQAGADNLRLGVRPVRLSFLFARWSQARGRADAFAVVDRN